jgi:hypothetical protein
MQENGMSSVRVKYELWTDAGQAEELKAIAADKFFRR